MDTIIDKLAKKRTGDDPRKFRGGGGEDGADAETVEGKR